MLIAICIQDDDCRSPFNPISFHQNLILVKIDLEGSEILLNRRTDIGIGISNSCQLLAPNSEIVIKVHQDQFLLLLRLCLGRS
jgi:hypothetical protein